jgi:hypothetical protein
MAHTIARNLPAVAAVASFAALGWAVAGAVAGLAMAAATACALAAQEGALDRIHRHSHIGDGRVPHVQPGGFKVHVARARTWS